MNQEFKIIDLFYALNRINSPSTKLGIGDDAAIVEIPAGFELVTSIDTSVSGVHFPIDTPPFDIGYKSLAVSLSDMAAMGAEPINVLLALTLPEIDKLWIKEFARGFFEVAHEFNVALIGGDTTRGPLSISTVVNGIVPKGQAILRSGAKVGDDVYLSGSLGAAAWALKELQSGKKLPDSLLQPLNRPFPRVALGLKLRGHATASIDLSDGFAQDINHLLEFSQIGAKILVDLFPIAEILLEKMNFNDALQLALNAGDDYELCFTAHLSERSYIESIADELRLKLYRIGTITEECGLKIYDESSHLIELSHSGYEHFKDNK